VRGKLPWHEMVSLMGVDSLHIKDRMKVNKGK